MTLCKFFLQGNCKNGNACTFLHEQTIGARNSFEPVNSASPASERLNTNLTVARQSIGEAESNRTCIFFMQGSCSRGDKCRYIHAPDPPVTPPQQRARPVPISVPHSARQDKNLFQASSDSRANIPCKFASRAGGCRNSSCPYLHALERSEVQKDITQEPGGDEDEDEDEEIDDDLTRELSGAMVYFNEVGHILKVSLPTDFSCACITGLAPGTTPQVVGDIIADLGFNIAIDCIRVTGHAALSEMKATVKVEDPLFAKELIAKLKERGSVLSASTVPIDSRRTNCRKVYISWHKGTRSVWLNFGNGEIAERVSMKFNEGHYKCLGQSIKSSGAKRSSSRHGRGGYSHNPVAWTLTLTGVIGNATSKDVQDAITLPLDKPRHVEMGSANYQASNAEVSVDVRSLLEEHGRLESFYLAPIPKGKRVKATAWFQDEAEARAACSLNDRSLDILRKGKLTVTLVQSVKVKIPTTVYLASKSRIENASKTWREQHLTFRIYPDASQRFRTLKVEGNDAKKMALASKTLDELASGIVLTDGEDAIWSSGLSINGITYKNLKSIEKELDVLIIRDKSRRELRFYGPAEKHHQAVCQITEMLRAKLSTSYEIELRPSQFSWMIQGGFKIVEKALGKNVAIFNVVLRTVTVNGTKQQYDTALSIMDGKRVNDTQRLPDQPALLEGDCPICFCEAESPIQTSCKHTYCLQCFEECCKSAASTSHDEFRIKCPGDDGTCATAFTLRELKEHLSSSVFETVLKSSFEEYIQRHPETFHYCPTPDCGYIYRCTTATISKPRAYTCPKCFDPICTSCHARHGEYTCAEYKDIASGGYEALEKLKRELNIKDCPKCTTPMEKTEGCNHMTCGGCKAHICWVCMTVFSTSGPCYDHMGKEHGGIGLGLDRFMDF